MKSLSTLSRPPRFVTLYKESNLPQKQRTSASIQTRLFPKACLILTVFPFFSINLNGSGLYKVVSLFCFRCLAKILLPTLISEILTFIVLSYLDLDFILELVSFLFALLFFDVISL